MKCTVIFNLRDGVDCRYGNDPSCCSQEFGADIESPCGAGICGKCKVRVEEGSQRLGIESKTDHLSPATKKK